MVVDHFRRLLDLDLRIMVRVLGMKWDPGVPPRLQLTQSIFACGSSTRKSALLCPAIYLCSLLPGNAETCPKNPEFEEEAGLTISVQGPTRIHLCGFVTGEYEDPMGDAHDTGKSHTHQHDEDQGCLRLTQAISGTGSSTRKSALVCQVGNSKPAHLCSLLPGNMKTCPKNLEFEDEARLCICLQGTLCLTHQAILGSGSSTRKSALLCPVIYVCSLLPGNVETCLKNLDFKEEAGLTIYLQGPLRIRLSGFVTGEYQEPLGDAHDSDKPHTHQYDEEKVCFRPTQSILGSGSSTRKSVLQCQVGNSKPIYVCSLRPGNVESCPKNLEFEEGAGLTIYLQGTLCLTQANFGCGSSTIKSALLYPAIYVCSLLPGNAVTCPKNPEFEEEAGPTITVQGPLRIHLSGFMTGEYDDPMGDAHDTGKPHTHQYDEDQGCLRLTQAILGSGSSTRKGALVCEVGNSKPTYICSLLPRNVETCARNLEFEEEAGLTFSLQGTLVPTQEILGSGSSTRKSALLCPVIYVCSLLRGNAETCLKNLEFEEEAGQTIHLQGPPRIHLFGFVTGKYEEPMGDANDPGKPHSHLYDEDQGCLRLAQSIFGSGSSTRKSVLQCQVGNSKPIYACSLLPGNVEACPKKLEFEEEAGLTIYPQGTLFLTEMTSPSGSSTKKSILQSGVVNKESIYLCPLLPHKVETCALNLEFKEEDEVIFSVQGPHSIHILGFFSGEYQEPVHDANKSDLYGEDISASESDDSSDYDSEEGFGDYSDEDIYPSSPVRNSWGMHEGDKRRFTIPPAMGYGTEGAGKDIPPNAWLDFDFELVSGN